MNNFELAKDTWDFITHGYDYDESYGRQKDDVELLFSLIGSESKNILEVCCGTGRVLIPLAEAGHNMTGIDCNIGMLGRLYEKAKGFTNIKYYYADAITSDWGSNFDVVIIACNTIQNIDEPVNISDAETYRKAQETFIKKSAKALKSGGNLFLVFDLFDNPQEYWTGTPDEEYFTDPASIHMDDVEPDIFGVSVRGISGGYQYDADTQMAHGVRRWINVFNGERHIRESQWYQRILKLEEIYKWFAESGLEIEQIYNGYHREPLKDNQYNNVAFGQVLYAGDSLSGDEWDTRDWHGKIDIRELVLKLALDICMKI